jgi:glycosyltransferase involved in cell wall biosynthesis
MNDCAVVRRPSELAHSKFFIERVLYIMLSIIIPTKNEEKLLPLLLDSIKKNPLSREYEIIVADAGSCDRTREIAQEYGARIIEGGMPAVGRNKGARAARGDILLFLDADVAIHGNMNHAIDEFEKRGLDVASCPMQLMTESRIVNFIVQIAYNVPITILEGVIAHGADFMMMRKPVHEKIGGFDEDILIAEDHDYMRRGMGEGKFGILRSITVLTFPRRYEQDGWLRVCAKFLLCGIHMAFIGPVKREIVVYHFDPYSEEKRIYKTPWSYRKPISIPVFIVVISTGLTIWYAVVGFLFVWLNIKKFIGKAGVALRSILLRKTEKAQA